MSTVFNYLQKLSGQVRKSNFNLSHRHHFDLQFGELVPFLMVDVVPGDEFAITPEIIAQCAPLIVNVNSDFEMRIDFFMCPHRNGYKDFNPMFINSGSSINDLLEVPRVTFANAAEFQTFYKRYGRLYNYFGLPQDFRIYGTEAPLYYPSWLSLLPLRALNQIYYNYYLDHSKYTAAQLETIRVDLMKNSSANLSGTQLRDTEGRYLVDYYQNDPLKHLNTRGFYEVQYTGDMHSKVFPTANKSATSIGTTVESLEVAKNLKKFYDAYLEAKRDLLQYSKRVFGISASEESSQPIHIGGSRQYMQIGQVTATTEGTTQPLGSWAGQAEGRVKGNSRYTCKEYGYIIGIVSITPSITYSQSMTKRLQQGDGIDFYKPELQTTFYEDVTGWQMAANYYGTSNPSTVVGYSVPYNHLRFIDNKVTGVMADTLSFWNVINTYAGTIEGCSIGSLRDSSGGVLDASLWPNKWKVLTNDIFAVSTEPQIYCKAYNNVYARRVLQHVEQQTQF